MRFVQRAPREGVNVSPTHPLKEAATLVVGIVGVFALAFLLLAFSVDLAVRFIPPSFEVEVFSLFDFEKVFDAAEDERHDRVQELLDRMAAHWDDAPYEFHAFVIESSDANAAALPGGAVLVTTALLDEIESENELAFVLGHELGHFKHRDHLRRLGRGTVYGLALLAISGTGTGLLPDIATFSQDLASRGFDRRQETDADRFGLELVHAEYGHVASSWKFFERLVVEELAVKALAAYLSTHPASGDRIEELEALVREEGWQLEGDVRPF